VSSVPTQPTTAPATPERRVHPRKRLDQLAYIGFGPDTGGVLLDISEEGLRCQIVGAVIEGNHCHLKFALPGRPAAIEADGQVVWSNSSRQGGGVRLVRLGPDVRLALQQWVDEETTSRGIRREASTPQVSDAASGPEMPPAAPAQAAAAPEPTLRRNKLHPVATTGAKHQFPLTTTHTQPQSLRFTRSMVIAGCVVVGVVALAFSGINPALLFSGRHPGTAIAAPTVPATLDHPSIEGGSVSQPEWELPAEGMTPASADDAADRSRRTVAPPAPPAPPAANAVSEPAARPTPRPPTPPANSQKFPMALPRPHVAGSSPPAVPAPEVPTVPLTPPAVPLLAMPALESRSPEPPQPVAPQTGADYQQAQLLSRVEPIYSALARQARLQGTVRINATIGTDGVPRSTVCLTGNSVLCQMAVEAIGKWRYQPATSDGQPVEAQTLITFNFQLR
jgi:periplasmic protein TonB